jgi:hypothetical protein
MFWRRWVDVLAEDIAMEGGKSEVPREYDSPGSEPSMDLEPSPRMGRCSSHEGKFAGSRCEIVRCVEKQNQIVVCNCGFVFQIVARKCGITLHT